MPKLVNSKLITTKTNEIARPRSLIFASQRGASDSVANFSALLNPTDFQNVSCLRLFGMDICPNNYAQSSVVSI